MSNRTGKLNPNLTFEEFNTLANRLPDLNGNWLYKVTQANMTKDLKYPYPMFELSHIQEAYFRTFHEAENFVKKNTADVYCSWITQMQYGVVPGYGGNGSEWLYDKNGELLDYTISYGLIGDVQD